MGGGIGGKVCFRYVGVWGFVRCRADGDGTKKMVDL